MEKEKIRFTLDELFSYKNISPEMQGEMLSLFQNLSDEQKSLLLFKVVNMLSEQSENKNIKQFLNSEVQIMSSANKELAEDKEALESSSQDDENKIISVQDELIEYKPHQYDVRRKNNKFVQRVLEEKERLRKQLLLQANLEKEHNDSIALQKKQEMENLLENPEYPMTSEEMKDLRNLINHFDVAAYILKSEKNIPTVMCFSSVLLACCFFILNWSILKFFMITMLVGLLLILAIKLCNGSVLIVNEPLYARYIKKYKHLTLWHCLRATGKPINNVKNKVIYFEDLDNKKVLPWDLR